MENFDVVVVGAGVGGVSAATEFALQGRSVLLVDKLKHIANPFKGELIQPGSLGIFARTGALAQLDAMGAQPIQRLICTDDQGQELCAMDYRWLPSERNHCLTHTYEAIVEALAAALPSSVEHRQPSRFLDCLRDSDGRTIGVRLASQGSEEETVIKARVVVGADGVSSHLRKIAGIVPEPVAYDHQVIAFDLDGVAAMEHEANTVVTHAGMRVLYPMPGERGRLYAQIPHGFLNSVGKSAVSPWIDSEIDRCLPLQPYREQIRGSVSTCKALSARRFIAPRFHCGAIALVGDAAHAVHPMAGQGMNAAVADAAALAKSLHNVCLDDYAEVESALEQYSTRRRREVQTIFEFSHRFAELFTRTTDRKGLARSRYILRCHGKNERLCYKIMHNISGLGYQHFTLLDRMQQLGVYDPRAHKIPVRA